MRLYVTSRGTTGVSFGCLSAIVLGLLKLAELVLTAAVMLLAWVAVGVCRGVGAVARPVVRRWRAERAWRAAERELGIR